MTLKIKSILPILHLKTMGYNIQTDFLVPESSYLTGAGSVFAIGGNYFAYNVSPNGAAADRQAMIADWAVISQDMERAAILFEDEMVLANGEGSA